MEVYEEFLVVEQKLTEERVENLAQAYRSAQKKQDLDDSDTAMTIDEMYEESDDSSSIVEDYGDSLSLRQSRDVPSSNSMLPPPTMQTSYEFDSPTPLRTLITPSTSTNPREDSPNNYNQIISGENPMSRSLDDNTDSYSAIHVDESASSQPELCSQKDLILDHLMVYFYDIFDTIDSSYRQRHGTTETSSKHCRRPDSKSTSSQGKNKRKNSDGQDENEDDEAVDGSRKRPRKDDDPIGSSQTETEKKSFACPYFQHNPQKYRKYRKHRSCRGPFGWDTISRLKEHLYRQHTLPPQCPRCCRASKDEAQLKHHQRSSDACPLREQEPLEGLDKSQVDQLKNRKSMFHAGSEEEKWKIIYLIIFPDTPWNGLPSPYCGDETTADEVNENSLKAPGLAQYEAYMNRELPRRVLKELEIAIEKLTGPIEETLKNQLENLIRNCQERLSREFLQCRLPVAEEPQQHPTIEAPVDQAATADWRSQPAATIETNNHPQSAEPSSSDALAQYAVPPETSLGAGHSRGHRQISIKQRSPILDTFSNISAALPSDPWWDLPAFVSESVQYATIRSDQGEHPSRVDLETSPSHTKKGKEKANSNAAFMEWNFSPFT